jgi:hypothetical protein
MKSVPLSAVVMIWAAAVEWAAHIHLTQAEADRMS